MHEGDVARPKEGDAGRGALKRRLDTGRARTLTKGREQWLMTSIDGEGKGEVNVSIIKRDDSNLDNFQSASTPHINEPDKLLISYQ